MDRPSNPLRTWRKFVRVHSKPPLPAETAGTHSKRFVRPDDGKSKRSAWCYLNPDHNVFINTFKDWWKQVQVKDLA